MNGAPRHSYVEGNDAKIETTASGDNHLGFAPASLSGSNPFEART
jgi:hypothetical protein